MRITRSAKSATIAVTLAGLSVAGCSVDVDAGIETPKVPQERVEQIVKERLTETVGRAPDSVTCDGGLEAAIDASIRCRLTADGETHGVTAKVTGVEGGTVNFDIQVDDKAFQ